MRNMTDRLRAARLGTRVQILEKERDKLVRQRDKLAEALQSIKGNQGKVCDEYELCHHRACASSYASWAIADEALAKLEELPGDMDLKLAREALEGQKSLPPVDEWAEKLGKDIVREPGDEK